MHGMGVHFAFRILGLAHCIDDGHHVRQILHARDQDNLRVMYQRVDTETINPQQCDQPNATSTFTVSTMTIPL
jgi:hypothetical protein